MSRAIKDLRKPFARKIRKWKYLCDQYGYYLTIYFTERTFEQQAALYAQGRKSLAQVNHLRQVAGMYLISSAENRRIVTKAAPGRSWHNYGLAVDFFPHRIDGKPDWAYNREPEDIYDEVVQLAKGVDDEIVWGGDFRSFKDYGHLEWHPGLEIKDALWLHEHSIGDARSWAGLMDRPDFWLDPNGYLMVADDHLMVAGGVILWDDQSPYN